MESSFWPPGVKRLEEIDVADCEYNSESVEIQGVVSPSSQGGRPCTDDYAVHCFSFSAWRRIAGPLVKQELTILRATPPGDSWSDFPAISIHQFNVILSLDETRAVFVNSAKLANNDDELLAIAEDLKQPVIISTARFGDLWLDGSIGWFEGEAIWNGETISLTFHTDGQASIDSHDKTLLEGGLKVAEELWNNQKEWKRKVDEFAIQELLELKNDNWLADDEEPLTAEQFKARMSLSSVSILDDDEFEFWHDDGDLFWGHSIQISGSLKNGLTNADIPG